MNDLLRQYEHGVPPDGYPWPWAHGTISGSGSKRDPLHSYLPIKDYIRKLAEHRCLRCGHPYPPRIADTHPRGEWTPCDEHCTHPGPMRVWFETPGIEWQHFNDVIGFGGKMIQAQWRILTVHHLDEDKLNCRWWNLAALCQRCHLRMQRAVVMGRIYHFEHSEWFKPYAAGFYARKYESVDLSRDETMARLEELLTYEFRFRQEALF